MFKPLNRYIQVKLPSPTSPERASGIVLPQDYAPAKEKYTFATVVSWALDVRFADVLKKNVKIIIDQSMIEEITLDKERIIVVLDNYVIGIIQ
jgi:co-chaperonin GroES (HSP10)